jgi:hypothetical protein
MSLFLDIFLSSCLFFILHMYPHFLTHSRLKVAKKNAPIGFVQPACLSVYFARGRDWAENPRFGITTLPWLPGGSPCGDPISAAQRGGMLFEYIIQPRGVIHPVHAKVTDPTSRTSLAQFEKVEGHSGEQTVIVMLCVIPYLVFLCFFFSCFSFPFLCFHLYLL